MGNKAASTVLDSKDDEKNQRSKKRLSDKAREAYLVFNSLPLALLNIVGDYLSNEPNDPWKYALIKEQPVTIALRQNHFFTPIAPCWYMGFLPHDSQWRGLANFKINTSFQIKNREVCLDFVARQSSRYCRVVIDVLVLSLLDLVDLDRSCALDELQSTLSALQEHLTRVNHVVISISEYDSFCFSFKDTIDKATGLLQSCNRQQALGQIIEDLRDCRTKSQKFDAASLFAFYFTSKVKPASDMYLVKCIILANHKHGQPLFEMEAPNNHSKKIMWYYDAAYKPGLFFINQNINRMCHVIHFNENNFKDDLLTDEDKAIFGTLWKHAFVYQDNPFVERIVINSSQYGSVLRLPRPSQHLTDASTFSGLIEITLAGSHSNLHLTQLNNGYFPHLQHLSITYARISGHLDSHRVPSMKTLNIELEGKSRRLHPLIYPVVRERVQLLLGSGRRWQLVAAQFSGGWSLASYDEPITNPQDDVKEESFHAPYFPPLIRELLLVATSSSPTDEWQSQLNGGPSAEERVKNHNDRILVWSPDRVQKITAISTISKGIQLNFEQVIPGETRMLNSLECHHVSVVLDSAALENLQSVELNDGDLNVKGCFPELQKLSLREIKVQSPWLVNAPKLRSLSCPVLWDQWNFSLNPRTLPCLSFLHCTPRNAADVNNSNIRIDESDDLGLSKIKHVVLDGGMISSPFLSLCRLNYVSHLELTVDLSRMLSNWNNEVWYCETLKIFVTVNSYVSMLPKEKLDVVLPPLPLVKKLIVTEKNCCVLLNENMPDLAHCTLSSPRALGQKLRCPSLKRMEFTGELSESDKKECLRPSTYRAIGAQPRVVFLNCDNEEHIMTWGIARDEHISLSLTELFQEKDDSSFFTRIFYVLLFHPVCQILVPLLALGLLIFFYPKNSS